MKSSQIFNLRPAPKARQTQIFYDRQSYCAFPHVIRLEGDELLIAFRVRLTSALRHHGYPLLQPRRDLGDRGRSPNGGCGGQELGLIYLGKGKVGGALAAHEIVPVNEAERSGFSHANKHEYPNRIMGTFWCWSDSFGLTWRLDNAHYDPKEQGVTSANDVTPCF
jgi:hypothetical protein